MADGGFDPCECVFSHESAMRRLLSLLRNSQNYCTDSECVQDMPGPPSATGNLFDSTNGMFTIMMLWMVAALALFFLRPASLRRRRIEKPGPSTSRRDDSDDPPVPPVQ